MTVAVTVKKPEGIFEICKDCPYKKKIDTGLYCINQEIGDEHKASCPTPSTNMPGVSLVHARNLHCRRDKQIISKDDVGSISDLGLGGLT